MRIKIPIEIIELEEGNYHLIVSSSFENGTSGNWAIDTGASKTVFDKNLPENFFISDNPDTEIVHSAGIDEKPLETTIGWMKPFNIGKYKIENLKVALLDLSHINKLYQKVTDLEICGLIGGDFLMEHQALINYKKKTLLLSI